MQTFREGRRSVRGWQRLPDPVALADWAQDAKTALAGVLAWLVATDLLGLEQAFLAPWAAVLVVHATVYRTVSRAGQQVVATFLGVLLAWSAGTAFGIGPLGMGVMLVGAFLIGRHRWFAEESATIATTGIVVLATNAIDESPLLTGRLLDTTVGVVVGLAVNLLVWPPLRDRAAWTYIHGLPHELADALSQMAEDLSPDLEPSDVEEWLRRGREVDVSIDHAWGLLRQAQESSRFNPRRSRPADLEDMVGSLHLLEQQVAEVLSLARTIATSAERSNVWDDSFRSEWRQLLRTTAAAIDTGEASTLEHVRAELGRLAREQSEHPTSQAQWHEYGGLLVNLRNIVDAAIDVARWTSESPSTPRRSTRYDLRKRMRELDRERAAGRISARITGRLPSRVRGAVERGDPRPSP